MPSNLLTGLNRRIRPAFGNLAYWFIPPIAMLEAVFWKSIRSCITSEQSGLTFSILLGVESENPPCLTRFCPTETIPGGRSQEHGAGRIFPPNLSKRQAVGLDGCKIQKARTARHWLWFLGIAMSMGTVICDGAQRGNPIVTMK